MRESEGHTGTVGTTGLTPGNGLGFDLFTGQSEIPSFLFHGSSSELGRGRREQTERRDYAGARQVVALRRGRGVAMMPWVELATWR